MVNKLFLERAEKREQKKNLEKGPKKGDKKMFIRRQKIKKEIS